MGYWFMLGLVLVAIFVVTGIRRQRDREEIVARVYDQGGKVVSLKRVRKGHPFPDTTRGWWAWRLEWKNDIGRRVSFVLTTRDGISEWRD